MQVTSLLDAVRCGRCGSGRAVFTVPGLPDVNHFSAGGCQLHFYAALARRNTLVVARLLVGRTPFLTVCRERNILPGGLYRNSALPPCPLPHRRRIVCVGVRRISTAAAIAAELQGAWP